MLMLTPPQLIPLLVLFLLHPSTTSLPQQQSPCRILPPYRRLKIISFVVSTVAHLHRIEQVLTAHCELFLLTGDAIRLHTTSYVIVTHRQYRALAVLQSVSNSFPRITVISHHVQQALAESPKLRARLSRTKSFGPRQATTHLVEDSTFYESYHEFHELTAKWKSLASKYSSLVRIDIIGKSVQQRDIYALTIGETDPQRPRRILITAMQHAREWVSTHVATYVAEKLAIYGASNEIKFAPVLKNTQVIIVPLLNPDGYVFSHIPIEDGGNRMQRKNRRQSGCNNTQNDGVDLNRNWGMEWGVGKSASSEPCEDNYIGTSAFSEPETDAVRRLVNGTDGIESHIDFHSYGCVVLGPWSYTLEEPPRWKEFCNLGHDIARSMSVRGSCTFTYARASQYYLAQGVMSDWMVEKNVLSFVVELRPANSSSVFHDEAAFELPEDQIEISCHEGLLGVERLLLYEKKASPHPNCLAETSVPDGEDVETPTSEGKDKPSANVPFAIGVSLGILLFVVLVTSSVIVMKRRRSRRDIEEQEVQDDKSTEIVSIDWTWSSAGPIKQCRFIQDESSSATPNS